MSASLRYLRENSSILSILGFIALIINLYIAWIFIAGPPLGFLSISTNSSIKLIVGIVGIVGIFGACFIFYWIALGRQEESGNRPLPIVL